MYSGNTARCSASGRGGQGVEERLTAYIVELARQYGRYGYRKIAALLRSTAGWVVNDKRVELIWRQEGLTVPQKQPKRGRLWFTGILHPPPGGAPQPCLVLRLRRRSHP